MARGIGGTKKRGSTIKVTCQLCGKVVTKAGLIGHMRWKHERDHKAPLIPIKPDRAQPVKAEVRREAEGHRAIGALHQRLRQLSQRRQGEAYMAEAMPVIKAYMREHKVTEAELYDQLSEEKRNFEELLDLVRRVTKHKG